MNALLDSFDVAADAFADLVFFSRHPLAVGQQGLIFDEINDHIGALESPDGAADNIAHPIFEFGEDKLFFSAADMLHEGLLGILSGDTPKTYGGHFHLDFVTDLGIGLNSARVKNRDLVVLGNGFIRDNELGEGLDITILLINHDAQFPCWADSLFGG